MEEVICVVLSPMSAVTSFISGKMELQREVMAFLRQLILDIAPAVEEKISYAIPFFYYHGPLCYLNPVPGAVDLGFVRGAELSNEQGILQRKGRKRVSSIRLYSLAEAEEHAVAIRQILHEAAILNNYRQKMQKAKR